MKLGVNLGSGQRRFESTPEIQWINVDCVSRPDQVPDLIHDIRQPFPWESDSVDLIVMNQVWEHLHLNEGDETIRECFRVLKLGGSLIITCPDMRALAQRWLTHQIDDYIFCVNVYGAWQGEPGDDHHWSWTPSTLSQYFNAMAILGLTWSDIIAFNWRVLPGNISLPKDWWICGVEVIK